MNLKWHKATNIAKTVYLINLPDNMKSWDEITDEQINEIYEEGRDLDELGVNTHDDNGNEIPGRHYFHERLHAAICKDMDAARDIAWKRLASNICVDDIDKPRKVLVSEKYKVYRAKDYRDI